MCYKRGELYISFILARPEILGKKEGFGKGLFIMQLWQTAMYIIKILLVWPPQFKPTLMS